MTPYWEFVRYLHRDISAEEKSKVANERSRIYIRSEGARLMSKPSKTSLRFLEQHISRKSDLVSGFLPDCLDQRFLILWIYGCAKSPLVPSIQRVLDTLIHSHSRPRSLPPIECHRAFSVSSTTPKTFSQVIQTTLFTHHRLIYSRPDTSQRSSTCSKLTGFKFCQIGMENVDQLEPCTWQISTLKLGLNKPALSLRRKASWWLFKSESKRKPFRFHPKFVSRSCHWQGVPSAHTDRTLL